MLAAGAYALAAPFINRGRYKLFAGAPEEYSAASIEMIQRTVVVDMLGLVTLDYERLRSWQVGMRDFPDLELQRLRESGVTVLHPAVGFTGSNIYRSSLDDILRWKRFIAARPADFMSVGSVAEMQLAKNSGKIGIVLGLQNSSHFRTLSDVDSFYSLGQRVSQLTYYDNALGGGSTSPHRGITAYGAQVIERMNAIGMAIDLSHCSDRTTLDAIDLSTKPALVTHSNCRALSPSSARCKADVAIRRLAGKGGVFGVTMVRQFVRPRGPAGIEEMLDHIDHIVKVAGIEHAGIGTDVDLDGRDNPGVRRQDLDGLQYSRKIFDITEGLIRRGYSPRQIELILGENFRRALNEIWAS